MSKTIDIKVGDTVKVIKPTTCTVNDKPEEFIPIGTICKVIKVEYDKELDEIFVTLNTLNEEGIYRDLEYVYCRDEVEKGRLEWIKDE